MQKDPAARMIGLRMSGLKSAKTRAQGPVRTAAAGKGKISSIIMRRWVAPIRFVAGAVLTLPKSLRQLPEFKPDIRNPRFGFT
jgi:hypothetical protein